MHFNDQYTYPIYILAYNIFLMVAMFDYWTQPTNNSNKNVDCRFNFDNFSRENRFNLWATKINFIVYKANFTKLIDTPSIVISVTNVDKDFKLYFIEDKLFYSNIFAQ